MEYELSGGFGKTSDIQYNVEISTEEDEEQKTGRGCYRGIWILLFALIICGILCFFLAATNFFTLLIEKNLTLRSNSIRFQAWKKPPINALLRVYLFNYTNIKEFESGIDKKLKIKEIGPYTYVENWERVNITYHDNGTMTYRDKKTYTFSQELSNGLESDKINVANIPFMGAMSIAKTEGFFVNFGINTVLKAISASPFIDLTVREFLWGYNDQLASLANHILSFKYKYSMPVFGIFVTKNQTQNDAVTIYTGEEDIHQTGMIYQHGTKSSLDYWGSSECNRIDGTDGTIYPPGAITLNSTLYLYVKDMCRRVPMVYESQKVDQHGIPVYRYHLARDVFESGKINLENSCFCNRKNNDIECMPSGVFNASPCAFGGPIITSLPHFLYGEPSLLEEFEGLSPHPEIHESFVEIDPKLSIPVSGKSRFQLNVMMRKALGLMRTPYKDKLILPVSWMDYGFDRLPDDLSSMIYVALLFADMIGTFMICFGIAIVMLSGFIIIKLILIRKKRRRNGLFGRNLDFSVDTPLVVCQGKT